MSDEQLREHLTFNDAASSDDVEANNSARSIVTYLQSRGWFDAHVTWRPRDRNPSPPFDTITFQIESASSARYARSSSPATPRSRPTCSRP